MTNARTSVGHPVDVSSGTVYASYSDIVIPGRSKLFWDRYYSTRAVGQSHPTPLGPGWTSTYFSSLSHRGCSYTFTGPDGDTEVFDDPEDAVPRGGVIRHLGTFRELTLKGGEYVITSWDVDSEEIERDPFVAEGLAGAFRLVRIEEAVSGQGLRLQHDRAGRLVSLQQVPEGRELMIGYTRGDLIDSVSFRSPSDEQIVLVRYEYDVRGRLVAVYDALGFAERYQYNHESRMTREMTCDGGVFAFRYDDLGRCINSSGTDRFDEKTLRYYDGLRWTEVTDSHGHVRLFQWNEAGQVVREVDPLGGVRLTEYDDYGRIIAKTDANEATTRFEYDARGNCCRETDASARHLSANTTTSTVVWVSLTRAGTSGYGPTIPQTAWSKLSTRWVAGGLFAMMGLATSSKG